MERIFDVLVDWLSASDRPEPRGSATDWHNGYGTQADHQVPAESDNEWRSDSADLDNWIRPDGHSSPDSSGQDFSSGSFND